MAFDPSTAKPAEGATAEREAVTVLAHDPNGAFLAAALTAIRISHEGGRATVELPNAVTGQTDSLCLDQRAARAFVVDLLDAGTKYALADPTKPPNAMEVLGLWLASKQQTTH